MEYSEMKMGELRKIAKEKAAEQGKVVPFGATKQDILSMLHGNKDFVDKVEARKEEKRQKPRRPLGRHRSKLTLGNYKLPPDKVGRWINDKAGRLSAAQDGGYDFVDDPDATVGEDMVGRNKLGSKISRTVGTHEDGSPMTAYFMVIDKDTYEGDQREKQRYVDEIDNAIKHGAIEGEVGKDGRYIPKDGIKVDSNF